VEVSIDTSSGLEEKLRELLVHEEIKEASICMPEPLVYQTIQSG